MTTELNRKRRSSDHNKQLSAKNKAKKRRTKALAVVAGFFAVASAATFTMSGTASASECVPGFECDVPEISALEGTAALAVVAAMLLLAWERRRKA